MQQITLKEYYSITPTTTTTILITIQPQTSQQRPADSVAFPASTKSIVDPFPRFSGTRAE